MKSSVKIRGESLPAMPPDVALAFARYPAAAKARLLAVRRLIFQVAVETEGVGALTECLKWGEPAYLTEASRSGSTIRLGVLRDGAAAMLFNCQTSLVADFRARFGDDLPYEKNRAIRLSLSGAVPEAALAICIAMALSYRRR